MPTISLLSEDVEFGRHSALLDTNVLVALHDDRDQNYEQAQLVIESESSYQWLITVPVIVEACGLLGSRRGVTEVYSLLAWVFDPGSDIVIVPEMHQPNSLKQLTQSHSEWMRRYSVDYVDASLMNLADRLTRSCDMRPYAPVFTFDTKDFYRCAKFGYRYSLYDMRTPELISFA
jgi:predicted nucleic acid-binding protein